MGDLTTASGEATASTLRRQYLHAFAATACVGPFLSYVLTDLDWSPRDIGFATAALTMSAVLTAPLWGRIDDAWEGRAAGLCLLATSVAAVLLSLAVTAELRAGVWLAVAVFGAASGSLEPLLTAGALRRAHTSPRLGVIRSAGSVGWIVGLLAGATVLTTTHRSSSVFLVAAVATVSAPRLRGPGSRLGRGFLAATRAAAFRLRRPPHATTFGAGPLRDVLAVLSITLPVPVTTATLVYFTAGWARTELHAGPLLAVLPLALAAALELPAFVLVDRLALRVRPLTLVAGAFPLLIAACSLLAVAPSRAVMLAVQPLVAMSFALWFVGQSRTLAERVPTSRLSSAQTLLSSIGRASAGLLAGLVGGAIAASAGYATLFLALAGLCALGAVRAVMTLLRPAPRAALRGRPGEPDPAGPPAGRAP